MISRLRVWCQLLSTVPPFDHSFVTLWLAPPLSIKATSIKIFCKSLHWNNFTLAIWNHSIIPMYFTSSSISLRLIRSANQRNLEMDYATYCVFVDEAGFNAPSKKLLTVNQGNPSQAGCSFKQRCIDIHYRCHMRAWCYRSDFKKTNAGNKEVYQGQEETEEK